MSGSHAVLFLAIAVIFVGLAVRNAGGREPKLSPASQTYLRIAFIFAAVSILLHALQWFQLSGP